MAETKKLGRPKAFKSPEELFQFFQDYVNHEKANPYKIKDWVGKDAEPIIREKEKPITLEGFENYVWMQDKATDIGDYLYNRDGRYSDFTAICLRIKQMVRQEQIAGGMAGVYNPSITQRLNGLKENIENTNNNNNDDLITALIKSGNAKIISE